MENPSSPTSLFDFDHVSAHLHPWQVQLHLLRQLQQYKRKVKISLLHHTEDLTQGQKRRTPEPDYSCTVLPRAQPSLTYLTQDPGLRCLPLKSRTGSNRTSTFNRAAVLSQGPLMELQDWDLGQPVCEKNESRGLFTARCRAAGLLMSPRTDAAEGRGFAPMLSSLEPHLERIG